MAATPRSVGFWQNLKRLPGRMPLRTKLITALLGLVALALAVISVAGIEFLHSYLIGQANNSIQNLIASTGPRSPQAYVLNVLNGGNPERGQQFSIDWLTSKGKLLGAVQPVDGYPFHSIAGPDVTPHSSWLTSNQATTVSASSGSGRWQVFAYPYSFPSLTGQQTAGTIIVGVEVTGAYQTLGKLTGIDLLVSAIILVGLFVVGIAVVRASLRPLTEIEQTAGAIAAGDITKRVPERDPRTEVGRLGRSLNIMLSQIEAAFRARSQSEAAARQSEERMRQFVADASHELRTPLTAIRGFAEYYRQRGGTIPPPADAGSAPLPNAADIGASNGAGKLASTDLDRIMRRVEQESTRMGVLVEDMLLLARLDQQRPLERSPVDLLTLAADAVHDARVVAPNRSINLSVGAGAALLVNGDEVRLRQVIGNLMSNALAHTPDDTPIDVRIRSGSRAEIQAVTAPARRQAAEEGSSLNDKPADQSAEGGYVVAEAEPGAWPGTRGGVDPDTEDAANAPSAAVLEVTDHGPGLTEEQARHAFERFYRADQARTSRGTGLGLAIVAALVKAHGGAVWVRSQPGNGATFSIALPLAPEAVQGAGDEDDAGEPEDSGSETAASGVAELGGSETAEPDSAEPDFTRQGQDPASPEPGSRPPGPDNKT
jgi:two-component system OmpR family sensor kinase